MESKGVPYGVCVLFSAWITVSAGSSQMDGVFLVVLSDQRGYPMLSLSSLSDQRATNHGVCRYLSQSVAFLVFLSQLKAGIVGFWMEF